MEGSTMRRNLLTVLIVLLVVALPALA